MDEKTYWGQVERPRLRGAVATALLCFGIYGLWHGKAESWVPIVVGGAIMFDLAMWWLDKGQDQKKS